MTLELVRLLSFIFVAALNFVECQQLSMVVESFNLRSAQSTDLKCSLIQEILVNKNLLKNWHCIGGTLAKFPREPGMWIMPTSPVINVEAQKMPFEIVYYFKKENISSISAVFDLGNEVNRQLTSTARMQMNHENSDLNATMTYIQFPSDKTTPCSGGISTGFVVALIEGIILLIIAGNAAFQFYMKKRVQIHSASGREGEENLVINDDE